MRVTVPLKLDKAADWRPVSRIFDWTLIPETGSEKPVSIAVRTATELPRPVAGEGSKQTLRIAMPWPSPTPKAPLFVWLRGETDGRANP